MIEFGEWLPDYADTYNPGATDIKNCVPIANGYGQLKSLSAYTSALTARCQGGYSCKDKDDIAYNFAGDASKLYSLDGTTYTNVSGASYSTPSDGYWNFAKYGEHIVATNYANNIQRLTLGGAAFADLSGTPPRARHLGVVREFLVLGDIFDSVAHTGRVQWCAQDDITDWTPSVATQAGYKDLVGSGGKVMGIVGGEYGLVFQERSIWRMDYEGAPLLFRFDEVEQGRGTPAPLSLVKVGPNVFYLGQDGFYMFNGEFSVPIGKNKVDVTFWNEVDSGNLHLVNGIADPINALIMWAAPVSGHSGYPNKLYIYNWATQRWSYASIDTEMLVAGLSSGYDMDSMDSFGTVDSIGGSVSNRQWSGGVDQITAFGSDHKQAAFDGAALTAVMTTKEIRAIPGKKATIRGLRTVVDGGTQSIKIASRNDLANSYTLSSALTKQSSGLFRARNTAFYHRFEATISGGFNSATGIELEEVVERGRR